MSCYYKLVLFYLFLVILLNLYVFSNSVVINTSQGKIKGMVKKTLNNRDFQNFLGIPYAKPPVDNLRFRDPVPFGTWEGERDATQEGSPCLQKFLYDSYNRILVVGDENCLFINVYTPNSKNPKQYPVMVYIHGGAFCCGSSSKDFYGPEYLLDKDIVLVTMNYRIGALGFASTEDSEMPGNYGLKDQVLGLKWVQESIASYGGNPDSVTLFGQSAGGISVHYHMMSPLSKGLFHRAIPMSGTALCSWAVAPPGVGKKRTQRLATLLGCPIESSKSLVDCLRSVSANRLTSFMTEFTQWDLDPMILFTPVIEPKEVENAFLTNDPLTENTTVPMMVGITSDEGVFRTGLFKTSPIGLDKTLEEFNDNFKEILKISVTIYVDENINYDILSSKIKKFYFGDKPISKDTFQNIVNMYTDAHFMQCAVSAARKHTGPVYFYYFAQRGPHSTSFVMTNSTEYLGVNHGDDIMYLFPMPRRVPTRKHLTAQEKKTVDEMVMMWTNFAIHGEPTLNKKWEKMTSKNINYLHIEDGKFEMRDNLLPDRVNFWDSLTLRFVRVTESAQTKD